MRNFATIFFLTGFFILATPAHAFYAGDITDKIWTLKSSPAGTMRWLIIRANIKDRHGDLYHVEILELKDGQDPWRVKRLAAHMALTENALRWSIGRILSKGDVYPETYDAAYESWGKDLNPFICRSNVDNCLKKITR